MALGIRYTLYPVHRACLTRHTRITIPVRLVSPQVELFFELDRRSRHVNRVSVFMSIRSRQIVVFFSSDNTIFLS